METYTTELMDPRKLKGNPKNPRRHPPRQVVALEQSLDENDWLYPVLWNRRTGRLIDGHARVKLAREKGVAAIPVRVLDVDEDQERRILASLDRIGALADIDDTALAALLQDCAAVGGLPPGYTPEELDTLLQSLNTDALPVEGDEEGETGEEEDGLELSHIRMVQLFFSTPDLERFETAAMRVQESVGTKNVSETMLWLAEHWTA